MSASATAAFVGAIQIVNGSVVPGVLLAAFAAVGLVLSFTSGAKVDTWSAAGVFGRALAVTVVIAAVALYLLVRGAHLLASGGPEIARGLIALAGSSVCLFGAGCMSIGVARSFRRWRTPTQG